VDVRLRRALVRVAGAATVVVGLTVTASAVRRADQVVASGREVLMGDRLVDTFVGRDLTVVRNVETAGVVAALGDLHVSEGSLRIERASGRVFAVGGGIRVDGDASIILPASGGLKYGTIRTGAPGSPDTVTRDPDAVAGFTPMVSSLRTSATCFAATSTTGLVRVDGETTTFVGDGVSALQVFRTAHRLTGPVDFERVPPDATVLVNVAGDQVTIAPRSDEWLERANDILVNVADATAVAIDARDGRLVNLLVGNPESRTVVTGDLYRGRLMTLGALELSGTRVEAGRLTATHLPECRAPDPDADGEPPDTAPAGARPSTPPTPSTTARPATSTTASSSTTTTTVVGGDVAEPEPVALGAAFSLGGAATSSQWWVGLPICVLGLLLLACDRAGRPGARGRRATRR
jgi:choice-of-anchor A domain-containing protein